MMDPRALTEQLDAKLDQVLKNPGGWGGMDALEPLVLMLLILRAEVASPRSSHREVVQQYRTFLARRVAPGHGDIRTRLGGALSLERMVEVLREYVEAVRVRSASPSRTPLRLFPRMGGIEGRARH